MKTISFTAFELHELRIGLRLSISAMFRQYRQLQGHVSDDALNVFRCDINESIAAYRKLHY